MVFASDIASVIILFVIRLPIKDAKQILMKCRRTSRTNAYLPVWKIRPSSIMKNFYNSEDNSWFRRWGYLWGIVIQVDWVLESDKVAGLYQTYVVTCQTHGRH